MMRDSIWRFPAFAIAFAVMMIAPAFLGYTLPLMRLMEFGDAFDLFTPAVLLPLYWWLLSAGDRRAGTLQIIAFLVFAALWVEGQGIHLAANSLGHLTDVASGSQTAALTHMYDEVLGHYLWHTGVIGLAAVTALSRLSEAAPVSVRAQGLAVGSGIAYGAVFFIISVEGVTWPIGVPFAVVATAAAVTALRSRLRGSPTLMFFASAHAFSLVLFAVWAAIWRGLPEFSAVGIIS